MTLRFTNPRPQFLDSSGNPLLSGRLFFYETGTSTLKTVYADANETTVAPTDGDGAVPLAADGRVPNIFYSGTARVVLQNDAGSGYVQVWDVDGVGAFGDGSAFSVWSSVTEYQEGSIVEASNDLYYRSLQNNNIGNDPTTSAAFWEQVSFLRTWNTNVSYSINDLVQASNGKFYVSLNNNNTGNEPSANPANWELYNPFDQDLNTTDDVTFADGTFTGDVIMGDSATGGAGTIQGASPELILNRTSGGAASRNWALKSTEVTEGDCSFFVGASNGAAPTLEVLRMDSSRNALFFGNLTVGATSAVAERFSITTSAGSISMFAKDLASVTSGENAADSVLKIRRDTTTSRSINAAGTLNASGADYAEYMRKADALINNNHDFNKGDIVGIDANGELTNIFDDAHTFMIKSTNPNLVGGDSWGGDLIEPQKPQPRDYNDLDYYMMVFQQYETEYNQFKSALEAERVKYDRIAYCGQVPVNVIGANAGDYLIPVRNNDGSIGGSFVASPTFEQFIMSIGKSIKASSQNQTLILVGAK